MRNVFIYFYQPLYPTILQQFLERGLIRKKRLKRIDICYVHFTLNRLSNVTAIQALPASGLAGLLPPVSPIHTGTFHCARFSRIGPNRAKSGNVS